MKNYLYIYIFARNIYNYSVVVSPQTLGTSYVLLKSKIRAVFTH